MSAAFACWRSTSERAGRTITDPAGVGQRGRFGETGTPALAHLQTLSGRGKLFPSGDMMHLTALLLLQASLPGPGIPYDARVDYRGPGLICGAAFSFPLREAESATLIKRSFIDAEFTILTKDGTFFIHESQYATEGGVLIKELANGSVRRFRRSSRYFWAYTDNAPGSTYIYGPAVDAAAPTAAFKRVRFGGPRYGIVDGQKCLDGIGSKAKVS